MDVSKLKVAELKAELGNRGLPVSGLKAVLAQRLQEALDAATDAPTDTDAAPPATAVGAETDAAPAADAPAPSDVEAAAPVQAGDVQAPTVGALATEAPTAEATAAVEAPPTVEAETPQRREATQSVEAPSQEEIVVHAVESSVTPAIAEPGPDGRVPQPEDPRRSATPTLETGPKPTPEPKKRKRSPSLPTPLEDAPPPRKAPFKPSRGSKSPVPPATVGSLPIAVVKEAKTIDADEAMKDFKDTEVVVPEDKPRGREAFKPKRPSPAAPASHDEPTVEAAREAFVHHADVTGPPPEPEDAAGPGLKVNGEAVERPSPPRGPPLHPGTRALYIGNLVRPFTLPQIKELVEGFGAVETFWMDAVKSHAYVVFADGTDSADAKTSLDGRTWPDGTGKPLAVAFVSPAAVPTLTEAETSLKSSGRPRQALDIVYDPDAPDAAFEGWAYRLRDFSAASTGQTAGRGNDPRPVGLASAVPLSAASSILAAAQSRLADRAPPPLPSSSRMADDRRPPPPSAAHRGPGPEMKMTRTMPQLAFSPVPPEEARKRLEEMESAGRPPRVEPVGPRWSAGPSRGGFGRGGGFGPRGGGRGGYGPPPHQRSSWAGPPPPRELEGWSR